MHIAYCIFKFNPYKIPLDFLSIMESLYIFEFLPYKVIYTQQNETTKCQLKKNIVWFRINLIVRLNC